MDNGSSDKSPFLALQRGLVAVLRAIRRLLGSAYQVAFRDRLRAIDVQTERLGTASVEAMTYLGSEVRALDQRLAAIERELAALRALLERRDGSSDDRVEEHTAHPPSG